MATAICVLINVCHCQCERILTPGNGETDQTGNTEWKQRFQVENMKNLFQATLPRKRVESKKSHLFLEHPHFYTASKFYNYVLNVPCFVSALHAS